MDHLEKELKTKENSSSLREKTNISLENAIKHHYTIYSDEKLLKELHLLGQYCSDDSLHSRQKIEDTYKRIEIIRLISNDKKKCRPSDQSWGQIDQEACEYQKKLEELYKGKKQSVANFINQDNYGYTNDRNDNITELRMSKDVDDAKKDISSFPQRETYSGIETTGILSRQQLEGLSDKDLVARLKTLRKDYKDHSTPVDKQKDLCREVKDIVKISQEKSTNIFSKWGKIKKEASDFEKLLCINIHNSAVKTFDEEQRKYDESWKELETDQSKLGETEVHLRKMRQAIADIKEFSPKDLAQGQISENNRKGEIYKNRSREFNALREKYAIDSTSRESIKSEATNSDNLVELSNDSQKAIDQIRSAGVELLGRVKIAFNTEQLKDVNKELEPLCNKSNSAWTKYAHFGLELKNINTCIENNDLDGLKKHLVDFIKNVDENHEELKLQNTKAFVDNIKETIIVSPKEYFNKIVDFLEKCEFVKKVASSRNNELDMERYEQYKDALALKNCNGLPSLFLIEIRDKLLPGLKEMENIVKVISIPGNNFHTEYDKIMIIYSKYDTIYNGIKPLEGHIKAQLNERKEGYEKLYARLFNELNQKLQNYYDAFTGAMDEEVASYKQTCKDLSALSAEELIKIYKRLAEINYSLFSEEESEKYDKILKQMNEAKEKLQKASAISSLAPENELLLANSDNVIQKWKEKQKVFENNKNLTILKQDVLNLIFNIDSLIMTEAGKAMHSIDILNIFKDIYEVMNFFVNPDTMPKRIYFDVYKKGEKFLENNTIKDLPGDTNMEQYLNGHFSIIEKGAELSRELKKNDLILPLSQAFFQKIEIKEKTFRELHEKVDLKCFQNLNYLRNNTRQLLEYIENKNKGLSQVPNTQENLSDTKDSTTSIANPTEKVKINILEMSIDQLKDKISKLKAKYSEEQDISFDKEKTKKRYNKLKEFEKRLLLEFSLSEEVSQELFSAIREMRVPYEKKRFVHLADEFSDQLGQCEKRVEYLNDQETISGEEAKKSEAYRLEDFHSWLKGMNESMQYVKDYGHQDDLTVKIKFWPEEIKIDEAMAKFRYGNIFYNFIPYIRDIKLISAKKLYRGAMESIKGNGNESSLDLENMDNLLEKSGSNQSVKKGLKEVHKRICEHLPTIEDAIKYASEGQQIMVQQSSEREDRDGTGYDHYQSRLNDISLKIIEMEKDHEKYKSIADKIEKILERDVKNVPENCQLYPRKEDYKGG